MLTTSLDKIVADINALIAPIEAAGGGGNIVLLMNPAQARKIGMAQTTTGDFAFGAPEQAAAKFGASRIISSTTIAAGRVIAVDADWFATATGDMPRFAVSATRRPCTWRTPRRWHWACRHAKARCSGRSDAVAVPDRLDRHPAVALRDLDDGPLEHGADDRRSDLVI